MDTEASDCPPPASGAERGRYGRARTDHARRRDQAAWRIVGWIIAAAVALLGYDAATAVLAAARSGRSWGYPAVIAGTGTLALLGLATYGLRRGFSRRGRR